MARQKFNDASFLKSVKFSNKTNFQDKAIFSGITVWENTKFESVFFDDESYFNGATLGNPELTNQQKTCFYESRFDKVADFSGTHFYSINKFTDLYFHEEANFYGSEFADDTSFIQNPNKFFGINKYTVPKYNKKQNFPMRNSRENRILRTLSSMMGQILLGQFFTKNQILKIFFSRIRHLILKMQNLQSVQVIGSQLPRIQFLVEEEKSESLETISSRHVKFRLGHTYLIRTQITQ